MLKPLIQQLLSSLGIEKISENADGSYLIQFEPETKVVFRENPEKGITLCANLGSLSKKHTEKVMLALLSANLFGRETGNAMLGLDKEAKDVLLIEFLPEAIDFKNFHDAVELFVNYADCWKQDLPKLAEVR